RECFSCHHQALPVLTIVDARRRGFDIDETNLLAQLARTVAHLKRGRSAYADGRGQGGQVDTAGWAMWALSVSSHPADETTEVVSQYLLTWQSDLGHWRPSSRGRSPTQGSDFTATYLALYGLTTFVMPEQEPEVTARKERVKSWLIDTEPTETEDHVFRLRALHELAVDQKFLDEAAAKLLSLQGDNGGWAQTAERRSDAYATGTVLATLCDIGSLQPDDEAYRRGVAFLLKTQLSDGSWHVTTRAKPIQVYFESGFPHGKDQFVSMAATCWATMALLKACPEQEAAH
nr:N-acyl-D-aspartate/D-glutamate deacylase [Planctomycetota bacterium]